MPTIDERLKALQDAAQSTQAVVAGYGCGFTDAVVRIAGPHTLIIAPLALSRVLKDGAGIFCNPEGLHHIPPKQLAGVTTVILFPEARPRTPTAKAWDRLTWVARDRHLLMVFRNRDLTHAEQVITPQPWDGQGDGPGVEQQCLARWRETGRSDFVDDWEQGSVSYQTTGGVVFKTTDGTEYFFDSADYVVEFKPLPEIEAKETLEAILTNELDDHTSLSSEQMQRVLDAVVSNGFRKVEGSILPEKL